jgi:hypothetical protein
MKRWHWVASIAGVCVLIFGVGLAELGWMKFFRPRHENIRREVFENTQSYTHGKIQDLAKYYREYQAGDGAEQATIRAVVQAQFARFDESKVEQPKLRSFLTEMRGY